MMNISMEGQVTFPLLLPPLLITEGQVTFLLMLQHTLITDGQVTVKPYSLPLGQIWPPTLVSCNIVIFVVGFSAPVCYMLTPSGAA